MTQSYVIILRPAPAYGNESSDEVIAEHFNYLKNLHQRGTVKMAGRFSDVLIGLVMVEAESKNKAEEIMKNDPAVRAGVFHAELYPWTVAVGNFRD